jgi:hypothetical protein
MLAKDNRPVIDWSGFDRIKVGMSRAQVESTLGGPEGDYAHRSSSTIMLYEPWPKDERYYDEVWWGDGFAICIRFDDNGLVADRIFLGGQRMKLEPDSWWDRLFGN